jgi:hypothetical protein
MKINSFAISILVLSLAAPGVTVSKAKAAVPPPSGYIAAPQERGGWDVPPYEFREIQRQGYHDGVEGARRDFENHRRPDVNNREEYRHPHVDASARQDYREGFRRGYENAVNHMMNDHGHDRDHDRDYDHR